MIPCKDCLILPICRNKEQVKCSLLYEWIDKDKYNEEDVNDCFPHLGYFGRYTQFEDDMIYFHYYTRRNINDE